MQRMHAGEIPWTVEGLDEFYQDINALLAKPKDDWPTLSNPPTFELESEDGEEPIQFSMNEYHPVVQVGRYLYLKYGNEGLAHSLRVQVISHFTVEHLEKLTATGLVRMSDKGPQQSHQLLEVLVTAKFQHIPRDNGDYGFRFDYDEVMAEIARRGEDAGEQS